VPSAERSVARMRCLVAGPTICRPHRGQLGGVAAGAGLGDSVVALVDGVEHAGDVGHPQPVQPDVADVRLELEPDVRLVAADGVAAQVLLGG
jgi:hypothetical protein